MRFGKSGEFEPKPNPAAPAMMIAGVTLLMNIASTCWMPSGMADESGGVKFGSRSCSGVPSAVLVVAMVSSSSPECGA